MATLADLRSSFLTLLERDDCDAALADTFLTTAMQRISRVARIPGMERFVVYNIGATDLPVTYVQVPPDLIQPIDFYVQRPGDTSMFPLDHQTMRQLVTIPLAADPTAYARMGAQFQIRGQVPAGSTITVYYYGELSSFTSDTDENELSASSPDLIIYGALSLAGEHFRHDRTDQWEARYQAYLNEITQQAEDVDANGGPQVVASAYAQCELE